jgi:Protein of unknown function (DUF3617)
MKAWGSETIRELGAAFFLMAALGVYGQSASAPVKAGLWETKVTTTRAMQLPPEVQARIASLPPEQQAMMKANMPGGGGQPITTTTQSCATGQETMDSLLSRAQSSAMKCTFPNRVQTADGASFDISCTGDMGTAKGHMEFHMQDADHVSGTSHITVTGSAQGRTMNSTMDNTTSAHWAGADCGSVKPGGAVVVK